MGYQVLEELPTDDIAQTGIAVIVSRAKEGVLESVEQAELPVSHPSLRDAGSLP